MSSLFGSEVERRTLRFVKTHFPRLAPTVETGLQRRTLLRVRRLLRERGNQLDPAFAGV